MQSDCSVALLLLVAVPNAVDRGRPLHAAGCLRPCACRRPVRLPLVRWGLAASGSAAGGVFAAAFDCRRPCRMQSAAGGFPMLEALPTAVDCCKLS